MTVFSTSLLQTLSQFLLRNIERSFSIYQNAKTCHATDFLSDLSTLRYATTAVDKPSCSLPFSLAEHIWEWILKNAIDMITHEKLLGNVGTTATKSIC
ncbi:hypothetical protein Trydic_g7978 [Trypoxylus dichotomus]